MNAFISPGDDAVIGRSHDKMSDALLVSAAKSGDAIAFVELSARHSEMILRRTYRIVRNWQDAEDVLQESFMKAFVHLNGFQERSRFSSWLTRIAINSALMFLRKKRGHLEISSDAMEDEFGVWNGWGLRDGAESPESRCARREREELLDRAIQALPPLLREVVQLSHGEDRTMKEIAQFLCISVPAVKSRLARAKTALRISLASRNW
jgi:RNA polymerase sigma-70 factor (ECF subfamily)